MTHTFDRRAAGLAVTLALFFALFSSLASAQTFRGGIAGAVNDPSGALVAGAQVTAVETATGVSYKAITSSAGEFALPNLPLGDYSITVTAGGFKTVRIDKVPVTAGTTYALPVNLGVASAGETVEVTADALAVDTDTDTQATVLSEDAVKNLPNNGRDYTQLIGQATGFGGLTTGGGGYLFSINGTRSNDVNYEIEGTDNNDLWWNIPAVNQTGVNGIAGVLLPVDAIENYSFVSSGSTELGRNPGGTANLTIRSGSNQLHGSAYYFNHNEAFQARNPFADSTPETRNQHFGFSLGGAIKQDKSFFFLSAEKQWFLLGAAAETGLEPSTAYQNKALALLSTYSVSPNAVSVKLLSTLWPANALTGPVDPSSNYHSSGNVVGYSYNSVIKLDENLSSKDHLSINWFAGEGTQSAPAGSSLPWYFENAPIHVQNYSVVSNHIFSPTIANQLAAGVSYFHQVFSDANTSFDPNSLGLDTGSTVPGAPYIKIGPTSGSSGGLFSSGGSGFDPIGVTNPSGRTDGTGHLNDDLNWTVGAHQLHFGGEYRHEQVYDFYRSNSRGSLIFDGLQGPWYADASSSDPIVRNTAFLADFLTGLPDASNSNITWGDPTRTVKIDTFALYAQDSWKVRQRLSVNYGIRYDFEGVPYTGKQDLSIFDPSLPTGLAVVGKDVDKLYNNFFGTFSPRVGFAYRLDKAGQTVLHGGYGFYYDSIFLRELLYNTWLTNGGKFGPQFNPAGSNEVANASALGGTIAANTPVFKSYQQALAGQGTVALSTIDKNFRPSYTQSYNLNVQHSFASNILAQIGYVGTNGTHLTGVYDINQAETAAQRAIDHKTLQQSRPYYNQFQNDFGVINELRSNLSSNYNSLQATLNLVHYHGLSSQLGYTWSHALDYETGLLPYLPQDSTNERAEYGNSDYDVRNGLSGFFSYALPYWGGPKRLAQGWELNTGFNFHGGVPFTVASSSNPSGTGEGNDRAQLQVANPFAGVSHAIVNSGGSKYVQWFSPTAFADAAPGAYATTRRNQFYNPGYYNFDLAVEKSTPLAERINLQIRAEIFNLFNHNNLSPLGILSNASETGTIGSTIGVALGNPGIGPGEPINAQFSAKLFF
jgi:hypothetical protein